MAQADTALPTFGGPAVQGPASGQGGGRGLRRALVPSPGVITVLLVALGLIVCAYCQDLSRETLAPNPWIFWFGIILIVAPLAFRITAFDISSLERISLVGLEGLALYAARLMRDPYGYSLTDEFPHALNLQQIASTHHLYHSNILLPITSHFPGLEGATSAIQMLTGMSSWGSGLLFIAFARLTLMLALYALFAAVSRSSRAAALGALLFAANSNYLIWETQFAYESLSLPLLLVVLAALAERHRSPSPQSMRAWGITAVIAIVAIIPTHHLTSYLLVILLGLMCIPRLRLPWPIRRELTFAKGPSIWPFFLLAVSLTFAWLIVVSSQTVGYLSPEVTSALSSTLRTVTGEAPPHALFSNTGAAIGSSNLLSEEAISFLEPLLLLIALPFGLRAVWRWQKSEPLLALMGLLAVAFFLVTVLRVVPSAWEISNRSGEFLFIGIAFVAGVTTLRYTRRFWRHRLARIGVGFGIGLCVVGGAVAGWPANSRIAHPTQVTAPNGVTVFSESEAVGRWFASQPKGLAIAADADAYAINLYGNHRAATDFSVNADQILAAPTVQSWMLQIMRKNHVRYVVADQRKRAQDDIDGIYFNMLPPAASPDKLYKATNITRWDSLGARVYDSGDVVVFDLDRKP